MNEPELFILDVGHGNCAVLVDDGVVTVIDCPPGETLIRVLDRLDIERIDQILISHADIDHTGGLTSLLENIKVSNLYVNSDASKKGKKGKNWREVRNAIDLVAEAGANLETITTDKSRKLISRQVGIEILAPSPGVALGGAGGEDLLGRSLTSNSMSAVIGLMHNSHRIALLPGDMDEVGLDILTNKHPNITAKILVFPHHGGTPGNQNGKQFAKKLCDLVAPDLVILSLDRTLYFNPKEDIIQGIRSSVPAAHIMCTQLSQKCSSLLPSSGFAHLNNMPAKGRVDDSCCGGTISIKIDGNKTSYMPTFSSHRSFVSNKQKVLAPLCL